MPCSRNGTFWWTVLYDMEAGTAGSCKRSGAASTSFCFLLLIVCGEVACLIVSSRYFNEKKGRKKVEGECYSLSTFSTPCWACGQPWQS